MIITRKRFEEAITKAKMEGEERVWKELRLNRMEEDIRRIEYGNTTKPLEAVPVSSENMIGNAVITVTNILSGILNKLIENKEKFCLTDDDKEIVEAKELLKKMGKTNE